MKKGKLSAENKAQGKLLDNWQHRPDYGEPIGCLATTYTFDAAFFEDHCLSRFVSMDTDPNEDPRAYAIEREEKLSPIFTGVLVDQAHVPTHRSLRWHAFPVRVPGGGLLHAKLSLLAWHHHVRVIISSANLSDAGYRKNLELAATLDFTPSGTIPRVLLDEILEFVEWVRQFSAGSGNESGPQAALRRFLNSVREHVREWPEGGWKRGEPEAALAITGPGRPSLFDRLDELWRFAPADRAWVVSPFFDEGDRALTTAHALESIMIQRDRSITFYVEGRALPDGRIELDMPAALRTSKRARTEYAHRRILPKEGEEPRPLHAKSIWLQRGNQGLYSLGSSNFTQPGTGVAPPGAPRHVELDLVYVLPDTDHELARVCNHTYPPHEEIDEDDVVSFVQRGDHTPDDSMLRGLPAAFGTATVVGSKTGLRLELSFDEPAPAEFTISLPTDLVVLRSDTWKERGSPALVTHELGAITPPSFLHVVWSDGELEAFRSTWPINIADPALLPAPEDLRDLKLEDLLQVLTSARPPHETVSRIIKAREAALRRKATELETDPHKKVDTSHHLLKRMRRAAAAMEELRARLERPTFSLDALRVRLLGPLGPLALAARLVAEEPAGAAFMLAELAATIGQAQLDPRGDVTRAQVREEVHQVLLELERMAATHPAPKNLTAYVETTFREVCR
jgi:hypothetical protein